MKTRKPAGVCPEHGPQRRVIFVGGAAYCPQDGCKWTCSAVTWKEFARKGATVARTRGYVKKWSGGSIR